MMAQARCGRAKKRAKKTAPHALKREKGKRKTKKHREKKGRTRCGTAERDGR
jgi:hypothetical protein